MNYHNITHDDMLNGDGVRVVLWVSGCTHQCHGCQNPETWNYNSGIPFDDEALNEIITELNKDYVSGITFSGGDPLHSMNCDMVRALCKLIKCHHPDKTIWMYTGYLFEDINSTFLQYVDVLVDGEFKEDLKDNDYHWAGSTNQRVIDVQKSLKEKEVCLYESH